MCSGEYAVRMARGRLHAQRLVAAPRPEMRTVAVNPGMTHVISGGTGGLGRAYARQLVEQGGRCLVLLGRNPALSKQELVALASTDAAVFTVRCGLCRNAHLQRQRCMPCAYVVILMLIKAKRPCLP